MGPQRCTKVSNSLFRMCTTVSNSLFLMCTTVSLLLSVAHSAAQGRLFLCFCSKLIIRDVRKCATFYFLKVKNVGYTRGENTSRINPDHKGNRVGTSNKPATERGCAQGSVKPEKLSFSDQKV